MEQEDHYSVLGLTRTASGVEITRAYRRMAQRFHPDVSDDPDAEARFKCLGEAYRTLKRVDTRRAYDQRGLPVVAAAPVFVMLDPMAFWLAMLPWPVRLWFLA